MNKARRTEIEKLKWKKRLRALSLPTDPDAARKYYCYRAQGKPCSCYMCRHEKYKRPSKDKRIPG